MVQRGFCSYQQDRRQTRKPRARDRAIPWSVA